MEHTSVRFPRLFPQERISSEARNLISALLRSDPERRLSIEQLLQEPWLRSGGARTEPLPQSDDRLRRFRESTAPLRAAVFATILQQHVNERPLADEGGNGGGNGGGGDGRGDGGGDGGGADSLAASNGARAGYGGFGLPWARVSSFLGGGAEHAGGGGGDGAALRKFESRRSAETLEARPWRRVSEPLLSLSVGAGVCWRRACSARPSRSSIPTARATSRRTTSAA